MSLPEPLHKENSDGLIPRTVGILQPGYLPWLGFFEQIARCDYFVLYDDVQFDKGGWRNRNRVKGPGGPVWLTVPVVLKGCGSGRPLIREVRLNGRTNWQRKHVTSIRQFYGKSPYFHTYAQGLFEILERDWEYLIDLNLCLIRWLCDQLGVETPLLLASDLDVSGDRIERLIEIIHQLGGTRFYEGAAGKDYIDARLFQEAGIEICFQDFRHPIYPQMFGAFVTHLSVIDLLFNCGPESRAILGGGAEEYKT